MKLQLCLFSELNSFFLWPSESALSQPPLMFLETLLPPTFLAIYWLIICNRGLSASSRKCRHAVPAGSGWSAGNKLTYAPAVMYFDVCVWCLLMYIMTALKFSICVYQKTNNKVSWNLKSCSCIYAVSFQYFMMPNWKEIKYPAPSMKFRCRNKVFANLLLVICQESGSKEIKHQGFSAGLVGDPQKEKNKQKQNV